VTDAHSEPNPATLPAGSAPVDAVAPTICPFLVAEAGAWRLAVSSRDHRCTAVSPPAALAVEKQERLCLTSHHSTCATYVASTAAREARLAPVGEHPIRWRLGRTTSVIEDPSGIRTVLLGLVLDRGRWPAIPAVILVTTLLALAVSGFGPGFGGGPAATATRFPSSPPPTIRPTPSPTAQPTSTATPGPSPSPTAAPSPTGTPGPTPQPTYRTYRVKSGDTLSAIASRFGTTVRVISNLNGIDDPSRLQVGQVLLIPW